jgi:hypothetical protein
VPVLVRCPNPACGKSARVPETSVGRKGTCRYCQSAFVLTPSVDGSPAGTPTAGDSAPASTVPARIGRFQIRNRLGAGAFGSVYRTYDPQLDREVALKVPHPGTLDGPNAVNRPKFLSQVYSRRPGPTVTLRSD